MMKNTHSRSDKEKFIHHPLSPLAGRPRIYGTSLSFASESITTIPWTAVLLSRLSGVRFPPGTAVLQVQRQVSSGRPRGAHHARTSDVHKRERRGKGIQDDDVE